MKIEYKDFVFGFYWLGMKKGLRIWCWFLGSIFKNYSQTIFYCILVSILFIPLPKLPKYL